MITTDQAVLVELGCGMWALLDSKKYSMTGNCRLFRHYFHPYRRTFVVFVIGRQENSCCKKNINGICNSKNKILCFHVGPRLAGVNRVFFWLPGSSLPKWRLREIASEAVHFSQRGTGKCWERGLHWSRSGKLGRPCSCLQNMRTFLRCASEIRRPNKDAALF